MDVRAGQDGKMVDALIDSQWDTSVTDCMITEEMEGIFSITLYYDFRCQGGTSIGLWAKDTISINNELSGVRLGQKRCHYSFWDGGFRNDDSAIQDIFYSRIQQTTGHLKIIYDGYKKEINYILDGIDVDLNFPVPFSNECGGGKFYFAASANKNPAECCCFIMIEGQGNNPDVPA